MDRLFLRVCSLSLSVGLLTLGLLVLRRLLMRRYTARWRCWVWLVLALRLALPLPLPLSIPAQRAPIQVELPRALPPMTARPVPVWPLEGQEEGQGEGQEAESRAGAEGTPSASSSAPGAGESAAPALPRQQDVARALGWLWAAGAAVCLGLQTVRYLLWRRAVLRWNRPVPDRALQDLLAREAAAAGLRAPPPLWRNAKVATPLVLGYVRPMLLVPPGLAAAEAAAPVLRHECIHIKRRDLWMKLLLLVAAAVHWFNPLAWLLRTVAQRDMELSCDEAVLAGQDKAGRIAYGHTLLDALEQAARPGDFTA